MIYLCAFKKYSLVKKLHRTEIYLFLSLKMFTDKETYRCKLSLPPPKKKNLHATDCIIPVSFGSGITRDIIDAIH